MSARSDIEHDTAQQLGAALQASFGPCACYRTGFGNERQCAMHLFISEVDRRSLPIPRVQRLIFVKAIRDRLLREEGIAPPRTATPVDPRGVLPWGKAA